MGKNAFTCPHCGAYAQQQWWHGRAIGWTSGMGRDQIFGDIKVCKCLDCGRRCIWLDKAESEDDSDWTMLWPSRAGVPNANADLPEEVRRDHEEAAEIVNASPRGAAALLRLGLEKLCVGLGGGGQSIYEDIEMLVEQQGLSARVQQALHTVRIGGNEAVHPGQLDIGDSDSDVAWSLFSLINLIAEQVLTQPKDVEELWERLPESKTDGVVEDEDNSSGAA